MVPPTLALVRSQLLEARQTTPDLPGTRMEIFRSAGGDYRVCPVPVRRSVNLNLSTPPFLAHFDHDYRETLTEVAIMWLAKSASGHIPQFHVLIGLLFVAGDLYLGFDLQLAFCYVGFCVINFAFGVDTFMTRAQHRSAIPTAHAAISKGDEPESPEESPAESDRPAPASPREQPV